MSNQFLMPSRLYTGMDALKQSEELFCEYGASAFIVTDPLMISLGNVQRITDILDRLQIHYRIFSGVTGEPTTGMIQEGYDAYALCPENTFIIAIGGGSVIDSAKAVAMMSVLKTIKNLCACMGRSYTEKLPPIIAIPTTAGTGSEVTQFTIITDEQTDIKMLLKGNSLMPAAAIVDPSFTLSVPPIVTAATGVDALCHAIEAYLSVHAQPLSSVYAVNAIQRILGNLQKALQNPNNLDARNEMALAALEAGIAFNNASVTIVHGMSRPIGALFHIPHGESNAVLLMNCLHFINTHMHEKLEALSAALHLPKNNDTEDGAEVFIKTMEVFLAALHIPSLSARGISRERFLQCIEKMSEDAVSSGSPQNLGIDITREQIAMLYQKLFADAC